MLARAIFAGNGLVHVGGVAPCDVAFGRQPPMLPPLEADELGEASGDCVAGAEPPAGGEAQPSRLQWRI
eukprot:4819249-Pyramimonas_sp.AAC.2